MSIAASEGELGPGDDDLAVLPPSGRVALPESDPGLTAMLSRAAESVGLHWRPPPSPECSRLDDWFLGAQADHRQSPQVPFFPEVHEEVTSSWRVPFSAQNRASASSVLTALDGGVAKGYVEIPPVERAIAVQLCPQAPPPGRVIHASRPGLVGSRPFQRPRLTQLLDRPPLPCTPRLSCKPTRPRRWSSCTRAVLTQVWCRNCAQRRTLPFGQRKSQRGPSVRRCPLWWSRNVTYGWTWQIWVSPTSTASWTPWSPRQASPVTRWRALPSSSPSLRSGRKPSDTFCPGGPLLSSPRRRLQPLRLLVAEGGLLLPPPCSSTAPAAAFTPAAAWSWQQESGAARLCPCQAREVPGQVAFLGRANPRHWVLLFRSWWVRSFPRWRAGWKILFSLCGLFRHWLSGQWCPNFQSSFLCLRFPRGRGRQCTGHSLHTPVPLSFRLWAAGSGPRTQCLLPRPLLSHGAR